MKRLLKNDMDFIFCVNIRNSDMVHGDSFLLKCRDEGARIFTKMVSSYKQVVHVWLFYILKSVELTVRKGTKS